MVFQLQCQSRIHTKQFQFLIVHVHFLCNDFEFPFRIKRRTTKQVFKLMEEGGPQVNRISFFALSFLEFVCLSWLLSTENRTILIALHPYFLLIGEPRPSWIYMWEILAGNDAYLQKSVFDFIKLHKKIKYWIRNQNKLTSRDIVYRTISGELL